MGFGVRVRVRVVRVLLAACDGGISLRLRNPRVAAGGYVEDAGPLERVRRVGRRALLGEIVVPERGDGGVRAVDHWLGSGLGSGFGSGLEWGQSGQGQCQGQ